MHRGYVKLWRKTRDTGILQDGPSCQFFMKALLDAAHAPSKRLVGKALVELEPGEFIFGRGQWSEELQVSEKVLRRVLRNFEKWAIIRASKRASKFTVFCFVNWDTYQSDEEAEGPAKGQQKGQQRASRGPHKKNGKKEKKEEERHSGNSDEQPGLVPDWREKFTPDLIGFVEGYQRAIVEKHGQKAEPLTDKLLQNCADTVDKLTRLDGHTPPVVAKVMWWAMADDRFWADQVLSLAALRRKSTKQEGDGRTKFQKVLAAYEREQGNKPPVATASPVLEFTPEEEAQMFQPYAQQFQKAANS